MLTFAALVTALTAPAFATPAVQTLSFPCDGCKTDTQLAVAPDADEVAVRDQLVVYLVGTQNDPGQFGLVVDAAASVGFHAVAVGWPNAQTFFDYCADAGTVEAAIACNDEYAMHLRLGDAAMPHNGWTWTADLHVSADDSVEGRVTELLGELAASGDAGWSRYLDAQGAVDWSRVVVAGFSQGALHARWLAASHQTLGLVMVDGGSGVFLLDQDPGRADVVCVDYNGAQLACAATVVGATPAERWAAVYDATRGVEADLLTADWQASGLTGTDGFGDSAEDAAKLGRVVYTQACSGGAWTHLTMSIDGWMPVDETCATSARYPEDAGAFHLYPVLTHLFLAVAGPLTGENASTATDGAHAGTRAAADQTDGTDGAVDADNGAPPAGPVGCDATGSGAPAGLAAFPLLVLALRRRR